MRTGTKVLIGISVVAVLGGIALVWANHDDRGHGAPWGFRAHHGHGPGFLAREQVRLTAMEMIEAVDADGDGKLTQAEIDTARNALHAAHDADDDGNLGLEEFAGVWREITRPLTVRAFQMLDTDGDAIVSRAEYDRPLANVVERLDRDGDDALSPRDRRRHHRHRGDRHDDD